MGTFERLTKARTAKGAAEVREDNYSKAAKDLLGLWVDQEDIARLIMSEELELKGEELEDAIKTWRGAARR